MIDPAGVDVERLAKQLRAHHAAFDVPARRAAAPRRIPFHLAGFARRRGAPDRKIGGVALAFHTLDPSFALIGTGARQPAVVGHRTHIEIQPAIQPVAVLRLDRLPPCDHCIDIVGRARMLRLANVEPRQIGLEHRLIMPRDVPGRFAFTAGRLLHLVVARIGVTGQVADIGDVDDVAELVALEAQHPPQRIGEHISAHVADVLVIIDRRPARIDASLRRECRITWNARVEWLEGLETARQAIEQP